MVILDIKEQSKFISKIDIRTENECWNWKASCMNSGYGQFILRRGKKTIALSAHRASFSIFNGEIPKGLQINHTCDNKTCVNPKHLYAGTQSDNLYDSVKRCRHKSNNLFGSKNPKAKLSEDDVRKIRELYDSKSMTQYSLSKVYKVSQHNIYSIVHRQTWKHI